MFLYRDQPSSYYGSAEFPHRVSLVKVSSQPASGAQNFMQAILQNVSTVPDVEHNNREQCIRVIVLPLTMLLSQQLNIFPVQNTLALDSFPGHKAVKIGIQMFSHPDR